MQDPGKPAHFGSGSSGSFGLFEPVVHDSALPRVVDGVRGCNGRVEEPNLLVVVAADSGSAAWQLDDRVLVGGGRGEALFERSVGGDEDVVCDQSDGEGNEKWVEQSSTATHFERVWEKEAECLQSLLLLLL